VYFGCSLSGANDGGELQTLLMMRLLMASWLIKRTLLKQCNLAELRRFEHRGVVVVGVEVGHGVEVCLMFSVNIGSTGIR
jgi:hypothetical protein